MSIYSYYMFLNLHRASWHSSATLTEGFPCFFLSYKANSRVKPAKLGYAPHSSKIVLFCVLYYCQRVATQLQLTNISYIKPMDLGLTSSRDKSSSLFHISQTGPRVDKFSIQWVQRGSFPVVK